MTRKTVIPLLRDLPSGAVIVRCRSCNDLIFAGELCKSDHERSECLLRDEFEELVKALNAA